MHAWKRLLVCQAHDWPPATLASHWRPSRQCWRTDWYTFVKNTLSYLPRSVDAATPASVKPKAGGRG
eukprot:4480531-Pyramimonas_sp.AAC.1